MAPETEYTIDIEKTETGFSASSPDIPGCGATGSTEQEARARMLEAIALHLEDSEAAAQVRELRASRGQSGKRASAAGAGGRSGAPWPLSARESS